MKEVFKYANQYVKESDWKVLALLKVCLAAIGIMIGMYVPEDKKKVTFAVTFSVFLATYVPLMYKFVEIIWRSFKEDVEA